MKILFVVNYYYPYISGVSEYLRLLAEEMVKRGHDVKVLASNHDHLKSHEIINGVKVYRAPIICKISKGTVSPAFIFKARTMAKSADIVNLHLPMLESSIISLLIKKNKLFTTYQCDLTMPPNLLNKFIMKVMDTSNKICLKRSQKIVVLSIDYAKHTRFTYKYKNKLVEISPPIKDYSRTVTPLFQHHDDEKIIGFCGRIVEEKGLDILLKAFKKISKDNDSLVLKIAGDYESVAGGSIYEDLMNLIREEKIKNVEFLGKLSEKNMEKFYSSLDVFVLPSTNPTEAFGMVQVEAMYCGAPVVASDLYGVRMVVKNTGMGVVVEKNNVDSLANGLLSVLNSPKKYIKSKEEIKQIYGTERCAQDYEKYFREIEDNRKK